MVTKSAPCLGPVTQSGCGALCPSFDRPCYGCFGPAENPNTDSLTRAFVDIGVPPRDIERAFRSFNGWAEPFNRAADETNRIATGDRSHD